MRHALDCGLACGLAECDCGAEPFIAYRTAPVLVPSGETGVDADGKLVRWHRILAWPALGTCRDMEHAKRKFGGSPVLEFVGSVH